MKSEDSETQTDDENNTDIRYGYIRAKHLDEDKIAYLDQACERNLVITYNEGDYHATMVKPHYKKRRIFICIPKQDALWLIDSPEMFTIKVKVKFELKYSYFDRLHNAIDLLSIETIRRLFPTDENCFFNSRAVYNLPLEKDYREHLTLEPGQREVVKMIVHAQPKAPVIVAGSFGTGKTRILAQAAFQILTVKKHPRVLVCAHHQ